MSIEYTWKVTGLIKTDTPSLSNVVINARWEKIGVDDQGREGRFSGATPFNASQIDPDHFVNFNNLNEEIVLGWVKSVVVGDYERHVNEQIQKQIDTQKLVVIGPGDLPWIPAKS